MGEKSFGYMEGKRMKLTTVELVKVHNEGFLNHNGYYVLVERLLQGDPQDFKALRDKALEKKDVEKV